MDTTKRNLLLAGAALLQACGSEKSNNASSQSSAQESQNGGSSTTGTTANSDAILGAKAKTALYLPNTTTELHRDELIEQFSTSAPEFYTDLAPYYERYYRSDKPVEYFTITLGHGQTLCKEYFDNWVTYQLANSFSLAVGSELSTVSESLVLSHLTDIRNAVADNTVVTDFMLDYFLSEMFWARFRSPEDNGREVFEIYLGDYRDETVPKAAIVLKNYAFDESSGSLRKSLNENTTAQDFDGTSITTPTQLYRYVVNHPEFMPHIYTHIVRGLFGKSNQDVIATLKEQQPTTFRDIYFICLFHPQMEALTRSKYPEEVLFPMLKTGNYLLHRNAPRDFANLMDQVGCKPLLSKLERQQPDWNELNLANLSNFVEDKVTSEAGAFSSSWSEGYSQDLYLELSPLVNQPAVLLAKIQNLLWRQEYTYGDGFTALIEQQSTTKEKLTMALRIVAMNYQYYQYQ